MFVPMRNSNGRDQAGSPPVAAANPEICGCTPQSMTHEAGTGVGPAWCWIRAPRDDAVGLPIVLPVSATADARMWASGASVRIAMRRIASMAPIDCSGCNPAPRTIS